MEKSKREAVKLQVYNLNKSEIANNKNQINSNFQTTKNQTEQVVLEIWNSVPLCKIDFCNLFVICFLLFEIFYIGSQSIPSHGVNSSVGCWSYFMQSTAVSLKCLHFEQSEL